MVSLVALCLMVYLSDGILIMICPAVDANSSLNGECLALREPLFWGVMDIKGEDDLFWEHIIVYLNKDLSMVIYAVLLSCIWEIFGFGLTSCCSFVVHILKVQLR